MPASQGKRFIVPCPPFNTQKLLNGVRWKAGSNHLCRAAPDNGECVYIARHDGSSGNDGSVADRDSRKNGGAGPYPAVTPDMRGGQLIYGKPRLEDIGCVRFRAVEARTR